MTQQQTTSETSINTGSNWKNINNWHWVSKDCLPWSADYLRTHLTGLTCTDTKSNTKLSVASVDSVKGDVDLNVRKGKVIYIFDLQVKLNVHLMDAGSGDQVGSAEVQISEAFHDSELDDYLLDITVKDLKDGRNAAHVKKIIKSLLIPQVHETLVEKFPKALVDEHGETLLVKSAASPASSQQQSQSKGSDSGDSKSQQQKVTQQFKCGTVASSQASAQSLQSNGSKYKKSQFSTKTEFKCSKADLVASLFQPQRVKVWTGDSSAVIGLQKGLQWRIYGNGINGQILDVIPQNQSISNSVDYDSVDKVVLSWSLSSWQSAGYEPSKITFTFDQGSDSTTIHVQHDNVPFVEEEQIKQNWSAMYFDKIKHVFGYVI
ncbi:hypothetical protein MP228_007595 [Amoeboaphelidium protococcarum]|nr:hypothetical protein MP228_007595 [Amoeboaphelidium protococcarum]